MREAKIPTIIGILVLIVGVVAGVFLVQSRRLFRLGAQGSFSPKDVRIGNVSDNSFTVSWVTDAASSGFVISGENQNSLGNISQDETGVSGFIHLATLINLKPKTSYFLKINSGGDEFDNNGVPWKVETGPALPRPVKSSIVSGTILKKDGASPKGALVYVTVSGSLLSTLASAEGNWVIPISQIRTPDLTNYVNIDKEKTLLEVSVEAGPEGVAQAQIYPKSANPMPVITLGKVYDFRSLPENKEGEPPKSEVELPPGGTPSSGFEVPQNLGSPASSIVTLESLKEGEIVTSTNPEFFGEGPGGTTITITVESEAQTTQIKIPSSGSWKWSPPQGLSEGAHRLTLTWVDTAGITRTLTRTFIVQAGEGPAFESTPSATLTPTPSPTPTPTPLPTATATVTPAPVPESGGLTTTILFSILGVGVIFASFAIWRFSN